VNDEENNVQLTLGIDEGELYYYLLEDIYNTLDQNPNIYNDGTFKISKPDVHFDKSKKLFGVILDLFVNK